MEAEFTFEAFPQETNGEAELFGESELFGEAEQERGVFRTPRRMGGNRPVPAKRFGPHPVRRGPPRVVGPWGVAGPALRADAEPFPVIESRPEGSERIRWVQDCLNQVLGTQLPITGVMGPETRSAVRSFQRKQGLRVSGIAGPDTEEALKAAVSEQGEFNFERLPFPTYGNLENELEVKIMIDEPARAHIARRLTERFKNPDDKEKIKKKINQLLSMRAPPEAVGVYEWYVRVGNLGDGTDYANIVAVGHMLRSLLPSDKVARGTRYVIRGGTLKKSGA